MCLAVIAHHAHSAYALIVVANRDEFHARPTARAAWWPNGIFAGRDLSAGGTWFGVTRTARFALLTNYRDGRARDPAARSRGELVVGALTATSSPRDFLADTLHAGTRYQGFNLVAGRAGDVHCASNRDGRVTRIGDGIVGLSNHLLDSPWPKVERTKARLRAALAADEIDPECLFDVLDDRAPAPDDSLPDTGIGLARERLLSSPFIVGEHYGTRSSSVLLVGKDARVHFVERTFDAAGNAAGDVSESFALRSD
jgi:uncharacterized protein with NRDE domain